MAELLLENGFDYSQLEDVVGIIITVWGLPLILIGICEAFFGYKILKVIRGLIGGFWGGLFGFAIGLITHITDYSSDSFWIYGIIWALVFAAIGAVINVLLLYVGVFLESWIISGFILSILFRSIPVGVIIGLLFAIVSIFIVKYSIIFFTAIEGGIVAGNALGIIVEAFEFNIGDTYAYIIGEKDTHGTLVSVISSIIIILLGIWIQVRKKKADSAPRKKSAESVFVPYIRYIVCIVFGGVIGIFADAEGGYSGLYLSQISFVVAIITLLVGISSQKKNWLLVGSWACAFSFLSCITLFKYLPSYSGKYIAGVIVSIPSIALITIISILTSLSLQSQSLRLRIQTNEYLAFIMAYGNRIIIGMFIATLVLDQLMNWGDFYYALLSFSAIFYSIAETSIYDNRYFHKKRRHTAPTAKKQGMFPSDSYDPAVDIVNKIHTGHSGDQYRKQQNATSGYWENAQSGRRQEDDRNRSAYHTDRYVTRPNNEQMTLSEAFGSDMASIAMQVLDEGDHSRIYYLPKKNDDGSWMCTCGNKNSSGEDICMYCGASWSEMREKFNYKFLSAAYTSIKEREESERRENERQKAEASAQRAAAIREQSARQKENLRHVQKKAQKHAYIAWKKIRKYFRRHPLVLVVGVAAIVIIICIGLYENSFTAHYRHLMSDASKKETAEERADAYASIYYSYNTPGYSSNYDSKRAWKNAKKVYENYMEAGDYDNAENWWNELVYDLGDADKFAKEEKKYARATGTVDFSLDEGTYDSSQILVLSKSDDATEYSSISYTLNGTQMTDDYGTWGDSFVSINLDSGTYTVSAHLRGWFGGTTKDITKTYVISDNQATRKTSDGESYAQNNEADMIHYVREDENVSDYNNKTDIVDESDVNNSSSSLNTELSLEISSSAYFNPEYYTVSSAQASSVLDGYPASNLIDEDLSTAWVEGDVGLGIGTTLTLQLSDYQAVHGIELTDGYLKSADLANKNARPSRIGISAGGYYGEIDLPYPTPYYEADKSTAGYTTYDADTDEYCRRLFIISFSDPYQIITDKITVTILDGVSGTKYDDLAISDIYVF